MYVFYPAVALTSIHIPASVTYIGPLAFGYARKMTSVTFEADSSLNNIGSSAFFNAEKLTSIAIPIGVIYIGENAFQGATDLTNVSLYLETIKYLNTANPSLSIPEGGGIMSDFYGSTGGNVTITVL